MNSPEEQDTVTGAHRDPREEFDRELSDLREYNARQAVLRDFAVERQRQIVKWGPQVHPNGTGRMGDDGLAGMYRDICDRNAREGQGTWRDILLEEVFEAIAESDDAKLRVELVQSGAVITAWIEAIDARA